VTDQVAGRIVEFMSDRRDDIVGLLCAMASIESPSLVPETQMPVQDLVARSLQECGFEDVRIPGDRTGGHILLSPRGYEAGRGSTRQGPAQILLGHTDTVWPLGTLEHMPVVVDEEKGVVRGPGVFDMKGGVVQMVFALRALSELGLQPEVTPVVFLNSDEEIGSPESHDHVERLAKSASRVLVMEPALSPEGMIKTTRRGVGQFTIRVVGKASHSGLAPEEGASAIQEMSHVIQFLHGLTDWDKGIAMNVGTVQGGTRGNVVAAECRGELDVRVTTLADARAVEEAIRGLEAQTPGTRVEIEGAVDRAPMEATPRNVALWEAVRACGLEMGVELVQGMSGGASDGNITSLHTATVDGLGPVGDGAHAEHEYVDIDKLLERTALLALTLMVPELNGYRSARHV
jgi:glutamate carboxypeptidase